MNNLQVAFTATCFFDSCDIVTSQTKNKIFIITTDGMENTSRRYSYDKVKQMIERQKEKYGWEFLFLGANINAIEVAGRFGIQPERAVNYNCDSEGTAMRAVNLGKDTDTVGAIVCGLVGLYYGYEAIPSEWLEKIQCREKVGEVCGEMRK